MREIPRARERVLGRRSGTYDWFDDSNQPFIIKHKGGAPHTLCVHSERAVTVPKRARGARARAARRHSCVACDA